jgi:hypothetical protein
MENEHLQKKQKIAEAAKEVARELTPPQTLAKLEGLVHKWRLDEASITFEQQTSNMFFALGLDYEDNLARDLKSDRGSFGLRTIEDRIAECEMEAISLYHRMRDLKLLATPGDESEDKRMNLRKIVKVMEAVYYAKRIVLSAFQAKLGVHQLHVDQPSDLDLEADLDERLGAWALRFRYVDPDTSDFQTLVLYLLDCAMEVRYRRYGDWLYKPIIIEGGIDVHAWKPEIEISKFVFQQIPKETNFAMWRVATKGGMKNTASAIEYLTKCIDYQLPILEKQRSVYSFNNGIYFCERDEFIPFDRPISDRIVACKYFDAEFTPVEDWRDIPTPYLDSIMEYQEWPPEVMRWLYIFAGRMLYPVGKLDGWQIAPFFKGTGSSGKCFCADTPVLMADGSTKPVQDVAIGDFVMGDDSTPRKVLTLARGVDEMFDIIPKNKLYPTITVTREHVLCLKWSYHGSISRLGEHGKRVRFFDPIEKKTRSKDFNANHTKFQDFVDSIDCNETFEMTVAEYLDLPKFARDWMKAYRVATEFPSRKPPSIDPWLLGVWLGDGSSSTPGFTTADHEILEGVQEAIRPFGCTVSTLKGKYGYYIAYNGKGNPFKNALRSYGLLNNKHIPDDFKLGSRETRMAVLAGLLDTDGYLAQMKTGKGLFTITQKNKRLADDIVFIARSLGLGATQRKARHGCMYKGTMRWGTYYRMNIFGAGIVDIPTRVRRKTLAVDKTRVFDHLHYGFDIKPGGIQNYYGFQTDGNQRFVLGDFTVTHNSTILLKIFKNFYEPQDVGILSSNIERQFGISAFHDKFLVIGPEIRNDLSLNQAEYQSIVSGEAVQVARKHQTAKTLDVWDVPIAFAGNEVPSWSDSGGAIQRRTVVFEFLVAVTNGDMKLGEKLEAELPAILQKCNKAYLEMAKSSAHVNAWSILPEYFLGTRKTLAEATSSVEGYLASDELRFGEDLFCPYGDFKHGLREFEKLNNYKKSSNSKDAILSALTTRNLKIVKTIKSYRGMPRVNKDWIVGVDFALSEEPTNVLG